MAKETHTVSLRIQSDEKTGEVSVSYFSDTLQDLSELPEYIRFHGSNAALSLGDVTVTTLKKDPNAANASGLVRPLWEKATCDIIK